MDQEPKAGGSGSTDGASAGEPKTLQEFLSLPENKEANMVVPLTWCPHLETTVTSQVPEKVDIKSPCKECKHVGENWICLKCLEIHCSRYVNEHMLFHSLEGNEEHRMSLSFSDLSVWCYGCDSYVDNAALDKFKNLLHFEKFGTEMPKREDKGGSEATLTLE